MHRGVKNGLKTRILVVCCAVFAIVCLGAAHSLDRNLERVSAGYNPFATAFAGEREAQLGLTRA